MVQQWKYQFVPKVSIEDYQILIWILISWLAACIFNFVSTSEICSLQIYHLFHVHECHRLVTADAMGMAKEGDTEHAPALRTGLGTSTR
jgi:hypothetical protein